MPMPDHRRNRSTRPWLCVAGPIGEGRGRGLRKASAGDRQLSARPRADRVIGARSVDRPRQRKTNRYPDLRTGRGRAGLPPVLAQDVVRDTVRNPDRGLPHGVVRQRRPLHRSCRPIDSRIACATDYGRRLCAWHLFQAKSSESVRQKNNREPFHGNHCSDRQICRNI